MKKASSRKQDIRNVVRAFIHQGKDLFYRLRSNQRKALTDIDLHLLRVQLHLLDVQVANIQSANQHESIESIRKMSD